MINVDRLVHLQSEIAVIEWDISQGQFNKRKKEYYQRLLQERDMLLKKGQNIAEENRESDEVMENESENYDRNWEEIEFARPREKTVEL